MSSRSCFAGTSTSIPVLKSRVRSATIVMLQERRPRRDVFAVIPEQAGIWVFDGIASGDALKSYGAASRAAAGYSSLLVQRRVTRRKHAPEPPTPPALLAESGARPTGPPAPRSGSRIPARTALSRGLIRLRLRCSAAATGPNTNTNTECAHSVGWVECSKPQQPLMLSLTLVFLSRRSSPSTAASAGGSRAPLFEPEARFPALGEFGARPASRGAQGTGRRPPAAREPHRSFHCPRNGHDHLNSATPKSQSRPPIPI